MTLGCEAPLTQGSYADKAPGCVDLDQSVFQVARPTRVEGVSSRVRSV